MQIEHTIRRYKGLTQEYDGTRVLMGRTWYHFRAPADDTSGPQVAEVKDEGHIKRFLSIPEYIEVGGEREAPAVLTTSHPAMVDLGTRQMPIEQVVAAVIDALGTTAGDWNKMSEQDRFDQVEAWVQENSEPVADEGDDERIIRIDPKSLTAAEKLTGQPEDTVTKAKPFADRSDKQLKALAKRFGVDENLERAPMLLALATFEGS